MESVEELELVTRWAILYLAINFLENVIPIFIYCNISLGCLSNMSNTITIHPKVDADGRVLHVKVSTDTVLIT